MKEFVDLVIDNKEWLFSGAGLVFFAWMGRLIFKKTRASSSQTIRAGDSSTNVQAGRDINVGMKKTRDDVEEE